MVRFTREAYVLTDPRCQHLTFEPAIDVYILQDPKYNNVYVQGFRGKKAKPDFFFRFKNMELANEFINKYVEKAKAQKIQKEQFKKEQSEKRKNDTHKLEVGMVFVSSWGYEQTNVDFYQITKIISNKMVEVREIQQFSTAEEGYMTAYCMPKLNHFVEDSKPMRKRVIGGNTIKIESFAWARLWDGQKQRYSWYA